MTVSRVQEAIIAIDDMDRWVDSKAIDISFDNCPKWWSTAPAMCIERSRVGLRATWQSSHQLFSNAGNLAIFHIKMEAISARYDARQSPRGGSAQLYWRALSGASDVVFYPRVVSQSQRLHGYHSLKIHYQDAAGSIMQTPVIQLHLTSWQLISPTVPEICVRISDCIIYCQQYRVRVPLTA